MSKREVNREVRRLRELLATRLSDGDRRAVLDRIDALLAATKGVAAKGQGEPLASVLALTFDRPVPTPEAPGRTPQQKPQRQRQVPDTAAPSSSPPSTPEAVAGEKGEPAVLLPLAPEEIERRSQFLSDIADRITLMRAVWATTLSFEVAREIELWRAKLQQVAKTIPRELAERALGQHVGYLTRPVQNIVKPSIPERVQERVLPPSMPSGKYADVLSEVYWWQRAPERPRETEHPPGYIPDGLQSWVS